MADQPPINPNDPNARLIDQLNRLNEHLARMNERAEETLNAAQQSVPEGEASNVGGQSTRDAEFTRLVDKLIERIDAQRTDPSSRPGQPNSPTGSHPPEEDEHVHGPKRRDRQTKSDASLLERLRYVKTSDEEDDRSRLSRFIDPRQPQGTASTPPSAQDPAMQRLLPGYSEAALHAANEPIELLPYGEYQLDTKLALARDFLARRAMGGQFDEETGDQPSAWRRGAGEAAGALNQAVQRAPQMHAAMKAYEALSSSLEHTRDIGTNMGFDPWAGAWTAQSGMGLANPLGMLPGGSEAARQGWQVRFNDARMRFMPGIGEEKGKEISSSLLGAGWSGRDLDALSFNYAVPLAQHGIDPQISAEFSQALRSGNTSVPELTKTLKTLGESARNAREPLERYAASMTAFANQMENMGLTRIQSLKVGQDFTNATGGMDPQVASQWAQNPIFQSFAMQRGYMPSQIGLMGGAGMADTQLQALKMMMGSAGGFKDKYEMHDGKMIKMAPGDDMKLAWAANALNMPQDQAQMLWRRRGIQHNIDEAVSMTGLYRKEESNAEDQARRTGGKVDYSKIGTEAGGVDWHIATDAAKKAGVTDSEIKRIMKDPASQWGQELETKITDHSKQQINDNTPKVKIDFTDRAVKWLQQAATSGDTIGSAAKAAGVPAIVSDAIKKGEALLWGT